jgi:hypothetical protein
MSRHPRKLLLFLPAALAAMALAAPVASAGVLVKSATSCEAQTLTQPFARWLDPFKYTPVPGGSFETGQPAWTLSGGARVVAGNEPFFVNSRTDSKSLSIPKGASVTSRSICVGLNEPTLRFFAKQNGGLLGTATSALAVSVMFETSTGLVLTVPIGAAAVNASWSPTLPMVIVANLLPLMPGDTTAVAFKFTAVTGNWQIDDVYVDPSYRR